MRKSPKKLVLHRETLRLLADETLQAAGGARTNRCPVGDSLNTQCAPTGPQITCGPECA